MAHAPTLPVSPKHGMVLQPLLAEGASPVREGNCPTTDQTLKGAWSHKAVTTLLPMHVYMGRATRTLAVVVASVSELALVLLRTARRARGVRSYGLPPSNFSRCASKPFPPEGVSRPRSQPPESGSQDTPSGVAPREGTPARPLRPFVAIRVLPFAMPRHLKMATGPGQSVD